MKTQLFIFLLLIMFEFNLADNADTNEDSISIEDTHFTEETIFNEGTDFTRESNYIEKTDFIEETDNTYFIDESNSIQGSNTDLETDFPPESQDTNSTKGNNSTENNNSTNDFDYTKFQNTSTMAEPVSVNETTPVATKPKNINNKTSDIQIVKFSNYKREIQSQIKQIKYNIYIIFSNYAKIAKKIFMRLRIKYAASRLRNLEGETNLESVRSECDKIEGEETIIKYDCYSNTSSNNKVVNVTLDTDIPIIADDDVIEFKDINFNGNSSEESVNLVDISNISKFVTLEDAQVIDSKNNIIKINGTLDHSDLLKKDDNIEMLFFDETDKKKNI